MCIYALFHHNNMNIQLKMKQVCISLLVTSSLVQLATSEIKSGPSSISGQGSSLQRNNGINPGN